MTITHDAAVRRITVTAAAKSRTARVPDDGTDDQIADFFRYCRDRDLSLAAAVEVVGEAEALAAWTEAFREARRPRSRSRRRPDHDELAGLNMRIPRHLIQRLDSAPGTTREARLRWLLDRAGL